MGGTRAHMSYAGAGFGYGHPGYGAGHPSAGGYGAGPSAGGYGTGFAAGWGVAKYGAACGHPGMHGHHFQPRHLEHPPQGANFFPVGELKNPPLGSPNAGSSSRPAAGGFDVSKLTPEQFAKYDTNGDGVIDASEMMALQEDIKAGNFKLKKATKGPSSYAYGDVKNELKSGEKALKKPEKPVSAYAYGDVKAELLAKTPPKK